MDVYSKIALVKAELVELKAALTTVTLVAERVAMRQRITAKENQHTAYIIMLRGESFLFSCRFVPSECQATHIYSML